jgi:hypothetical protein
MDCILPEADSGRTYTKRIDEYAMGFIFVKQIHRMYMLRENNCGPTRGCRRLGQGSARKRWNAVLNLLLK